MHWSHFLQFHITFDQWIEFIATVAGLLCVLLATQKSLWNFFFGLINAGSFFILFHDKKLYADMVLHLIYVGFQFYGFYEWKFGGNKHHGVKIFQASFREWILSAMVILFLTLIMYYVLSHYTDSTSIPLDSITTAMSLVASWMLARKWIENWYLWMAMDGLAVVMMLHKGLDLSAGLYFLYTLLCIHGIIQWRKELHTQKL